MNLKELSFPIRIYWDLGLSDNSLFHLRICEELTEAKILKLDLLDTGFSLSSGCMEILKRLKSENIYVSLTISHSALNPPAIKLLKDLNVRTLLIGVSSMTEVRSISEVEKYKNEISSFGVSFNIGRADYKEIPDVLSFCVERGITGLVFPMQRLTKGNECFYMDKKEQEELGIRLKGINYGKMDIVIHDPFIWRAFYASLQFPEGGCQAANSMAYISQEGNLYPCPSMPLNLGNLNREALREILLSEKKKNLRKDLAAPPSECLACSEIDTCRGGCRGRAYVLKSSLNKPDPACR